MTMPYMIEVLYEKPVPPDWSREEKRKGGSTNRSLHRARTSTNPSDLGMKQSTPMLLIIDGRLGHSDVRINNDDFVDLSPSWKGTSIRGDSPSKECKSDDTTNSKDQSSKDVVDELKNYFKG
ncbi:Probable protein phosphatase 2C 72 [Olea europaea subsp. europaea]|nr:Probable protein phosphatase 2C 72 [Olea europaea subsp. europaea]